MSTIAGSNNQESSPAEEMVSGAGGLGASPSPASRRGPAPLRRLLEECEKGPLELDCLSMDGQRIFSLIALGLVRQTFFDTVRVSVEVVITDEGRDLLGAMRDKDQIDRLDKLVEYDEHGGAFLYMGTCYCLRGLAEVTP